MQPFYSINVWVTARLKDHSEQSTNSSLAAWTLPEVQNDLQQASGVNVPEQTIRKRLHEGGLRARCPPVGLMLVVTVEPDWYLP